MSAKDSRRDGPVDFRRGQSVTVRSLSEILATLDADGSLEGMPFMPEMAPFCGKTFRVFRRAERTCVEVIGMRSMKNAVFLAGLRCDGSAHGGCQRGCVFFWKEVWLKPGEAAVGSGQSAVGSERVESRLPTVKGDRFYCQSTELGSASGDLPPGKLRLFLHDLWIGEMSVGRFVYLAWRALVNRGSRLVRDRPFYQVSGEQKKTASASLNLQAGELVEIKSLAEIEATLDVQGRNRGLSFDPEMALYCGRRYRVATPLRTIISEETGKIVQLNDTVILDGLICRGICGLNCPRTTTSIGATSG